ncbi:MAG: methyltransferase domain-containing protein [Magnetovibrio sp.]|nr:methyltransferase domain-containing protein [Magnetovibrio sp.]
MVKTWDPDQYLKFHGPRIRPALELLARIEVEDPATVYDLGCGPGNLTGFIQDKWPGAEVIGVDSSLPMLDEAREKWPDNQWVEADLNTWAPPAPADVLYSNAAFQWLGDHDALFVRLLDHLKPGGALAIQMPRNWQAPSHVAMREAAVASPWADRLLPQIRQAPVADPEVYYDLLRPHLSALDIWEVEYLQVLEGDNAVAEWTRGTALRALLDVLDADEREVFFDQYSAITQKAYPKRADGATLYPFRRLFMVGTR